MGSIRKIFTNTWNIFLSNIILIISFSWLLFIFPLKNLPGKENRSEIYAHCLHIFLIKIRYSWILWKLFVNRNIICQVTTLGNRNNIHDMKLLQIGIGIYSWPKYQQIDSWWISSWTIRELLANRELFAEHWAGQLFSTKYQDSCLSASARTANIIISSRVNTVV